MTDKQTKPDFVTEAEMKDAATVMARKYASFMNDRAFQIALKKDNRGVYATVTLANASGSYFYPVEGRMAALDHEMSQRDAALFLLSYIDLYFAEYFREGGDMYLPIDWADYEHDGVKLQLKGQILNLEVERMADALLERGEQPLH